MRACRHAYALESRQVETVVFGVSDSERQTMDADSDRVPVYFEWKAYGDDLDQYQKRLRDCEEADARGSGFIAHEIKPPSKLDYLVTSDGRRLFGGSDNLPLPNDAKERDGDDDEFAPPPLSRAGPSPTARPRGRSFLWSTRTGRTL